jgi:hypothetical protein
VIGQNEGHHSQDRKPKRFHGLLGRLSWRPRPIGIVAAFAKGMGAFCGLHTILLLGPKTQHRQRQKRHFGETQRGENRLFLPLLYRPD